MKIKEKEKKRVEKTTHNENVKINLYNELIDNFTNSLKLIIDNKIKLGEEAYEDELTKINEEKKEAKKQGYFNKEEFQEYLKDKIMCNKKITRKSIAQDLEISEQALLNYETDRIVSNKLLPTLRSYFNVSYSTLFGEITSEDIESAKNELAIGLSKEAIDKLSELQSNSLNDTFSNNYENKFKLFIINNIICDDKLIDNISQTFSYYLGRIEANKKMKKNNFKIKNPKDDYYLITLYRFISSIENRFDELAKSNATTPAIKKCAAKIAKKYSSEYQEYLK